MVDFKKSLNDGLEAAKNTEKNKQEIQSVLDELNSQVQEVTEGKLNVVIKEYYVNNSLQDLANVINFKPRETYKAIVALNPTIPKHEGVQIARWKMDRSGYPCHIYIGDDHLICEDREGLETGLQQLLSDPVVGEILFKVMNLTPPAELESGSAAEVMMSPAEIASNSATHKDDVEVGENA